MVAFNFQPRFARLVETGEKLQTIRRDPKVNPGQRLQLFEGMRTKACRKLLVNDPIVVLTDYCAVRKHYLTFGNKDKHPRNIDEFARMDGFTDYREMYEWFAETYKATEFVGRVVRWKLT